MPIGISSMGSIELFNHLLKITIISYLGSYDRVQFFFCVSWEYLIDGAADVEQRY